MITISTESDMLAFGSRLAEASEPGVIIFLAGPLGAGKTTLARGFLRGLGYTGHVKSPTYTLVEAYHCLTQQVYHFDLYRIKDPEELEYIGLQEYFTKQSICIIEWAEQGASLLPEADLTCYIELTGSERKIQLESHSVKGQTILKRFLA